MTFLSKTEAYVTQEGTYQITWSSGRVDEYKFEITYYINKQASLPSTPPSTETDFTALSGEWLARDGTGTATGIGGPYTIRLNEGHAIIEVLEVNGQEAYINEAVAFAWDIYAGSVFQETITIYDTEIERALVTRLADKKFKYTFPGGRSTVTITIQSSTVAFVEEQGTWTNQYGEFPYKGTYYMDKVR